MTDTSLNEMDAPARRPGVLARLRGNGLAMLGFALMLALGLLALAAPLLPLADPDITNVAARLQPPFSDGALLGTDQLGRDMLSRLVWGTRVSLAVGLVATLVATLIGAFIGLVAGYYGGRLDNILMRGIDMLMAFPYLLLALAIVAALGPGLLNAMFAIALVNIPFFARAVRGATVSLTGREFVDAARLCGLSGPRIIGSELLPNVMPIIVITMSTTLGWMVLETAGLSFLGLGAQPPQADLGSMLGDGRKLILTAPYVATLPGLVILFLVVGTNLLGDGLRDILDPRLKAGQLSRPVAATAAAPPAARRPDDETEASAPGLLALRALRTHFEVGEETYKAVNGVTFDVSAGEAVAIVGESGSGKTVMAMSILGLVATPPGRIVGGQVLYGGEDMVGAPLPRLQDIRGDRIAYIFQDPLTTLNPLIPVGEQVAESIRRHRGIGRQEARDRVLALFEAVQIPDAAARLDAYPHELSGGQRQRVGIAMALANDPEVLIADEPTTALDVTTQAQILKLLDRLRREQGAALLFITHDFGVVSELCDRVIVMYAGQMVESGTVAQVFAAPRHPYTRRLMACVPVLGSPERALDAIPGLPPPVNRLPKGCAFAPRCDRALPSCRSGEIALRPVAPDHLARCIRAEEEA